MRKKLTLLLGILLTVFAACSEKDEDECMRREVAYVVEAHAPSTAKAGEAIPVDVKFQVMDGCGEFGKFIETVEGNTATVEVEALYVGCLCTENMPIRTATLRYTPPAAGNYLLRFRSGRAEYISVALTVEE